MLWSWNNKHTWIVISSFHLMQASSGNLWVSEMKKCIMKFSYYQMWVWLVEGNFRDSFTFCVIYVSEVLHETKFQEKFTCDTHFVGITSISSTNLVTATFYCACFLFSWNLFRCVFWFIHRSPSWDLHLHLTTVTFLPCLNFSTDIKAKKTLGLTTIYCKHSIVGRKMQSYWDFILKCGSWKM